MTSEQDAAFLYNNGVHLFNYFQQTGDPEAIDGAIDSFRAAAAAFPADHPRGGMVLSALGSAYMWRFELSGEMADLDWAVDCAKWAAQATPAGHGDRPNVLTNLGMVCLTHHRRTGDTASLDDAVRYCEEAAEYAIVVPSHGGIALSNASLAYRTRFELASDVADLIKSIEYAEAALRATPDGGPDGARNKANLAGAYQLSFGQSGNRSDLDRSIELWQQAEAAWGRNADYAGVLSGLGLAYRMRFQQDGDGADLDEAIGYSVRAVRESAEAHAAYGGLLSNCSAAYKIRFDLFLDSTDLDAAFRYAERAVATTPDGHPERAGYLCQLATMYQLRFQRDDLIEDSDEAIRLGQAGVDRMPPGHVHRGLVVSDLGLAYRFRFERTGDPSDLAQAIRHGGEAVRVTPPGHTERALRLSNLSLAYLARHECTGAAQDLAAALAHGTEAVEITPESHPDRAMFLSTLASAHLADHKRGAQGSLDRALACWRSAVSSEVTPAHQRVRAAVGWGTGCENLDDPAPAAEGFAAGVRLLPLLAWRGLDRTVREQLLADARGLVADAAAWAIEAGNLENAAELLEQGRSVLWSQSLQLRTDLTRLSQADEALATRLDSVRAALDRPRPGRTPRELAREWDDLLGQVRRLPGFKTFLAATPFSRLREAASGGPVIMVNVSSRRCDALIVTKAGIRLCHLPLLTADECVSHANALVDALSSATPARWRERVPLLFAAMSWLWDTICEPVLADLCDHGDLPAGPQDPATPLPRLWWCPTGPLTVLPLHAAGRHEDPDGGCLSQVAVSSYAPTLAALLASRERGPGEQIARVLAVGMPTTPSSGDLYLSDLDAVPGELACLTETLPDVGVTVLRSPTRDELSRGTVAPGVTPPTSALVLRALASHSCVHFACHGGQDLLNPSQGAVYLTDGPLTVLRLAEERLPAAELAFLSACQTAVGGAQLPDEAIHLAAALQFAGYRHVIATAWSIGDKQAPDVARDTYSALKAGRALETSRAAAAIHGAAAALKARHPRRPDLWAPYLHIGP